MSELSTSNGGNSLLGVPGFKLFLLNFRRPNTTYELRMYEGADH
jgi:hypothetical protein